MLLIVLKFQRKLQLVHQKIKKKIHEGKVVLLVVLYILYTVKQCFSAGGEQLNLCQSVNSVFQFVLNITLVFMSPFMAFSGVTSQILQTRTEFWGYFLLQLETWRRISVISLKCFRSVWVIVASSLILVLQKGH